MKTQFAKNCNKASKTLPTNALFHTCSLISNKAITRKAYFSSALTTFLLILFSHAAMSNTYYVATPANGGNNNNAGTFSSPFATWGKLSAVLIAGDIGYIRGGTYRSTSGSGDKVLFDNLHGTLTDTIKILAYPGETPILNLDNITTGTSHSAMVRINNCDYIHIKGLRVTGAVQSAIGNVLWGMLLVDVNNSVIENCITDHIGGYGLSIGAAEYGSGGDNNLILNCDAYACEDPYSSVPFGGSNGFTLSRYDNTSTNITLKGCRAWNNSDDGFDLFGLNGFITFKNCWSFRNGYHENTETHTGDGMGFKLGPTSSNLATTHLRTATNCVSAHNSSYGFDQNTNSYTSLMWLYNNFSYNNSSHGFFFGYGISATDIFRNNIEYGSTYGNTFDANDIHDHNDWDASPSVTISDGDFVSLDETQLDDARQVDGSLPNITFGHLAVGSDLIDAGVNIGISYNGTAPDLGAFEYSNSSNNNQPPSIQNQVFQINENSPNGTIVGMVLASDPDAGQTLSYSILSGNTSGAFSINTSTGVLTVSNLAALNFEITPTFALVVKVQDNGTGNLNSQAIVTVSLTDINEAPVINNQSFSLAENSVNATTVGNVIASDPDAGQTKTFSILSGNTSGAFLINSTSGILTVANSAALNFEATPSFALIVKVQDNGTGTLSSQATVTVSLTDVNEAPVISNQSFSLAENTVNGTSVGTVVATDPDAGQTKTFSILSGNTNGAFTINASSGVLSVASAAALNFEVTPTFALVVKVQDNGTGSLSSQATVTVSLLNVNEVPVITNQAFAVAENSANGTTVGTVVATDPDAGQTKTFSILSGNTNGAFVINVSSGVLSVASAAALNFEVTPTFALVVKVQDNGTGNLSSQATVTISLTDVNETPVINSQSFSLAENTVNGTIVGTVVATDPDAGQTKTFSILSGNTSGAFVINVSSGVLSVANSTALNFEITPTFALVIKVQDNGTGTLNSQATITVSLTDLNETPVISNQVFSIAENTINGTIVGTIVAIDPDAGQTKTFSILSGNTSSAFAINTITGILSVINSSALNFETTPSFALVVKVQDNGTGSLSSQATVTVSLTDVNEVPVIANQAFNTVELTPNGTIIGLVNATDPDAGQVISYLITSGNTNNAFSVNASTGSLTVANSLALNYLVNPVFSLNIKVTDNGIGNLSSDAVITINLLQATNQLPVINNQTFSVNENSTTGSVVGTVIATDPDAGQLLSFSILSGNASGAFAINASNGLLSVANSTILNFEATPTFTLVVKVQDNGTGNLSSQATITVSLTDVNEAPVISNQSFSLAENTVNGTFVGTVVASDPDAGQTKAFSILSGNTSGAFAIDATSGVISVANTTALNFETTPSFALVIKVQDNGAGTLSSQATVTVSLTDVNEVPVINNQAFPLAENSLNGAAVGTIIATDPDAGQLLSFSILSGNASGAFAINASNGLLSVANSTILNFEATPTFTLVVKVQDNGTGNLSSQATITVSLTDVNEVPVISNQSFSIAENSVNGTSIGTVIASDPDAGQTKTFSILSGNTSGAFAIDATSGVLSVATSAALNFEATPSFALAVKVQDNGTGSLSSQATVTVSLTDVNEVPVISNQTFSTAENALNGTIVGTIVATDPDAGQTKTFLILSGNTSGAFAIDAISGVLSVATSAALNFEATPSFALVVKVQDNGTGTLNSQATVTVSLTDVNEVPVISNQTFSTAENALNGTIVGTIVATDPDAGQTKTFSILSGNTSGAFAIDATSGVLSVATSAALNFEATPSFALVIKVQDNGTGSLSSQATVTVSLTDVNEVPVISNQSFSIAENAVNGTTVGTVIASDPDAGQSKTFSILSGNTSGAFAIDATSGVLSVATSAALNFETTPSFALVVKVQDNGTGSLSSQATVTVSMTDVNEAPVIINQSFSLAENTINGTPVGTCVATDPDAGQFLSYLITSGNTNNAFSINALTGVLTVANSLALNFLVNPVFSLNVKVSDNGTGNLFSAAILTINLFQAANQAPVINNQAFSVNENSTTGSIVGTVIATDPDAGQLLSFSLLSGNTSGAFAINVSNGLLSVANSTILNFEATPSFTLVVKVQDNGTGSLSSQATVTVSLTDVNEVPVISNQSFSIAENAVNGTTVGTVIASDPDAGQSKTFSILSGNTSGAFAIDAISGVISVANTTALNFEATPSFALVVQVQDNGTGTLSSQAIVTVSLTDVNEAPAISNQSFSIAENSVNGSTVGIVVASDPDAGQLLSYQIISGNTDNAFSIDPITGTLNVVNAIAINYLINPSFLLIVRATDNGSGNLSGEASISISIIPNPNQFPVVQDQTFLLNENSGNGTAIGVVNAYDPDSSQILTFSIVSGNLNNAFSINLNDGSLLVNNQAALNFESYQQFIVTVSVQDNGSGNLTSFATITIDLSDINEPPVMSNQTFTITENSPSGTEIGQLIASDPDNGQIIKFSVVSGNDNQVFNLDELTGILSVSDPTYLVYSLNPSFTLTVIVQDNGSDSLSTLAVITINLLQTSSLQIIYIDPTNVNDPAKDGSIEHPYNSWIDIAFKDGYTYLQKRGTTYMSSKCISIPGNANITIDAYGSGNIPVIYNTLLNKNAIELINTKNCSISNIEVTAKTNSLACINVTGDLSSNLTIDNCILHKATYGIRLISRIKGMIISNTSIYKTGLDGINADNFESIEIGSCTIYSVNQNWFKSANAKASCMDLKSDLGFAYIHDNVLDHSETGKMSVVRLFGTSLEGIIERNKMTGKKISDNQCLNLINLSGVFIVRYNTISGGRTGIICNSTESKIYYNQFDKNTVAIRVQQYKTVNMMNNTFVGNDTYSIECLSGSNVNSKNNIYFLTPAATKVFKTSGTFVSDFNTFNVEKAGFLNGYSKLTSWISASGQDSHSFVGDPLFENTGMGDYKIKSTSPCINKGTDMSLEKDYFGTFVPQAGIPDMGFCEVNSQTIQSEETSPKDTDLSQIEISAYPNPTKGIININMSNLGEQTSDIRIINMNGTQVYSSITTGQEHVAINLENEKPGMYIVAIAINGHIYSRKIIVQD